MIILNQNNLTKYDVARETYKVGQNYTTKVNLNVRTGPGINYKIKSYFDLTKDGRNHAIKGIGNIGILNKGTTLTVKHIVIDKDGNTWLEIPSGYIAGIYKGNVYVS